ncbi:integrase/recombinase XerD [Candidatus Xenohaliotis californiensis]|uniref:Integrase/recombinase XerD n=1 Tax=Candidatus Xenohaliotis californiensis TaxID=84677 RepID=A0ABP0ERV6_9RICK|nr:integrase/recombinase XerD [Candidatus Xenohaliotis californiensis]
MTTNSQRHNSRLIDYFLNSLNAEKAISTNTLVAYKTDIKLFAQTREKAIDSVSRGEIESYIYKLFSSGIKKSSIARKVSAFRSFYKFLYVEGIISSNVHQFLQIPKKEQKLPNFLTQDTVKHINFDKNKHSKSMLQAYTLFEILYGCGLRISEALNLTISGIKSDNNGGSYAVIRGKGSKERIVPLPRNTESALLHFIANNVANNTHNIKKFIFFNNRNKKPITRQYAYKIIKNLFSSLEIDNNNISPHTIRHTYAVHLLENGMDIRVIQDLLGHAQLSTTQIYTTLNRDTIRKTMDKTHPINKMDSQC